MDTFRVMEAQEVLDDLRIPAPTEPALVEAFRGDAGKGDLESGSEVVVDEAPRIVSPQRREAPPPQFARPPVHPAVLVVRRNSSDDDPVDVDAPEDAPKGIELSGLPGGRGLLHEREAHRLREERRHA